jgi:apolipoprotein N-acyltransferase
MTRNHLKSLWFWLAPVLTGVLMVLSHVPWEIDALIWIAWIPLLSILVPQSEGERCPHPFLSGYLAGMVFWAGTIWWLVHVTGAGLIGLVLFLSLYFGLWSWWMERLRRVWPRVSGLQHILIAFFGACGWITLDWLKAVVLGGFPWNDPAISQFRKLILVQIAEWTGRYGLSFVIVFFNISLWLTWRRLRAEQFSLRSWRYEFSLALLLVVICVMIGMKTLFPRVKKETTTLNFGLVQPNIPQDQKYERMNLQEQRELFEKLTLVAAGGSPDLILWPETAMVDGPSFSVPGKYWLEGVVRQAGAPILLGAIDAEREEGGEQKFYNAAILITPDGSLSQAYRKMQLVPFGEYVPFEEWMPWLRKLTPIKGTIHRGQSIVLFTIKGVRIGSLICFEDTFTNVARRHVLEGATLLVNLTNDAWFKTTHASTMHAANAVFRAVESRRPLVRCTNNGHSMMISPEGRIIQEWHPFKTGAFTKKLDVPTNPPLTFYTRHGEWFAWGSAGMVLLFAIIFGAGSRVRRPGTES